MNPTPEPLADWLPRLTSLRVARICVEATCMRGVALSDSLCAASRGLIGERMRDLRCLTGAPTCEACAQAPDCDYARIIGVGDVDAELHPYWLQGVPAAHRADAGQVVSAELYVAGDSAARTAYLDVALRDALRRLGSRDEGRDDVRWRLGPSRIESLSAAMRVDAAVQSELTIEAQTPLLRRGDLALCAQLCPAAPWFALLIRAGIRRLDALLDLDGAPPRPKVALPSLADVRITGGELTPWRDSRWSQRQERRFPLEGYAGRVTLAGDALAEVAPLLRTLALTSVGRKTTMGFGSVRVTAKLGV